MRKQRQSYTPEFEFETVMGSLGREKSKAQICHERNIIEPLLYCWQPEFLEKAPGLFDDGYQASQAREKEEQIAESERMVGHMMNNTVRQLRHRLEIEYMIERIRSALDYATSAEFQTAARVQFLSSLIFC